VTATSVRVLIAFHTAEGQTKKIADYIAGLLGRSGAEVDLHPVDLAPSPARYDAVVVGDSIHLAHHSKGLKDYLLQHAAALEVVPSALFQVSITSIDTDAEHVAKAREMVDTLLEQTGFRPDAVGLFAGSLAYTKYGWAKRRMVAAIAQKAGLDTNTTRDREYTDWNIVAGFAAEVLALATAHGIAKAT